MCENDEAFAANNTGKVYAAKTGDLRILCGRDAGGNLVLAPPIREGWRERPCGAREAVTYHMGLGWLSADELFALRQTDPRGAP